jgi:hypothetical protein
MCSKLLVYKDQYERTDEDNHMTVNMCRTGSGGETYMSCFLSLGAGVRAARCGLLLPVVVVDATCAGTSVSVPGEVRSYGAALCACCFSSLLL